ncbi:MAG: UDP-N-acetylmuramoyl-L-alanyl-D-glutamate--2,6-diaminopimelate ligase [Bacteroidales bacterium]|nr:UDP-N-acetylmuramoyl-L-alanyl-D-glutamate--2,6-diaminopimelate ligase [Bacteroidales bacterium]
MKLSQIIKNCGVVSSSGSTDIEIGAVCNDSRKVVPGCLFVAVNGCGNDGRAYIGKAIEAGAAAVMYEMPDQVGHDGGAVGRDGVTTVIVKDSRKAIAYAADAFYGHPSGSLKLVGITGTNGKTTTVTLLYRLFRSLGYECGLLSTIANYVGSERLETANTTSDPLTTNSLLSRMVEAGCEYCFMEVSSIGVEQERVTGLEFAVGIFSNLTHDHLDYHGTFAEYLRCKKRFFDELSPKAVAITNIDDKHGEVMLQNTAARKVTYSCRRIADHSCRVLEKSFEGMLLRIDGSEVWTRLIGMHNAYNVLAIYSTAIALGANKEEVLVAISSLESAPGRLETIHGPRGLCAVIDYAHTPDALENVLATLREVAPDRQLVCLFGCGGDRDRTKRPEMAAVAGKWADRIFVTSDNSRTERTEDIMEDIRAGFDPAGLAKALFIADRKEAIRTALMTSPDGSTVLLAGKGHENYQIIGTEKRHFDEKEIVKEIFKQCSTTL